MRANELIAFALKGSEPTTLLLQKHPSTIPHWPRSTRPGWNDRFGARPLLGRPTQKADITYDSVINNSAAAHPARSCPCGTRTAANVVVLEMKKVVQKLNRTPKTFALEPPCTSPSVPQAPDRWCIRQKKSTSGMALKERFNSGPR